MYNLNNKAIFSIQELKEITRKYLSSSNFLSASSSEVVLKNNPFRRPMRKNDVKYIDFLNSINSNELSSNQSLAINRILFNIYEQDLVFLPIENNDAQWKAFYEFYDKDLRVLGEIIKPELEQIIFGFLDKDIEVSGKWTKKTMIDYFHAFRNKRFNESEDMVCQTILKSSNKDHNAQFLLIQNACDFLTEASAMCRNILGNYGNTLSELFKLLIDEYGYALHKKKHSTLYEQLLVSVGLDDKPHAYWQFYLPTSLMLTNYFHYISRNHNNFLRYLGALYFTETDLVQTSKLQLNTLREVYGNMAKLEYFEEHVHIDSYHSSMTLDNIIIPMVTKYGEKIIPEIIKGFEEFSFLQRASSKDIIHQIRWSDDIKQQANLARTIYDFLVLNNIDIDKETFREGNGERSTTHIHDDNRLLIIELGEMLFWPKYTKTPVLLKKDDMLYIPAGRLHGSVVTSSECIYHQPIVTEEIKTAALASCLEKA